MMEMCTSSPDLCSRKNPSKHMFLHKKSLKCFLSLLFSEFHSLETQEREKKMGRVRSVAFYNGVQCMELRRMTPEGKKNTIAMLSSSKP
jgi:hypothetical protein